MRTLQENRNMLNWRTRLAAFVLVLAAPLAAMAQNSIRSITTTQQAGAEVVRIELAEPLATVPNGFAIQTPPRIAIDLPGMTAPAPLPSATGSQRFHPDPMDQAERAPWRPWRSIPPG